MHVQITRRGQLSIAHHLTQMIAWLDREGIPATDLHPVRALPSRITFSAEFDRSDDAERFRAAFDQAP